MPKRKRDQDGLYRRGDSPYWWASYINARGKRTRRSTQTTDRKEAEALLAKWRLAAHRERQWDEPPARTFDDLMLAYLRATATTKRSTVRDQCSLKHLYPVFTGQNLYELQQSQVRAYIAQRRSEGAAASTINKEVGLLSSAIGCAQREWGWEVPNPAARCKQREPEGIVRWISRAEAMALIEAAQHDPRSPHLADFIRLGLHTAMRKGEMLGLEWCRVDLQAGLIHLQARHTKTAKRRSIPMNAEARTAIMGRFRFRAQYCPGSPWVFAHADGTRIGDVKRAFVSACRRAGIADFRVHDLRHTCAAWLVSAGVPLVEVRDLLGHKSIAMTERYGHLAPENLRAAVSRIEGGESRSGHVTKTG
jgi:integrase